MARLGLYLFFMALQHCMTSDIRLLIYSRCIRITRSISLLLVTYYKDHHLCWSATALIPCSYLLFSHFSLQSEHFMYTFLAVLLLTIPMNMHSADLL